MDRKTLGRLARLEQGRGGAPEFWMALGDGMVRNARTGEAMAEAEYRARYPNSRSFTFSIDQANAETLQ